MTAGYNPNPATVVVVPITGSVSIAATTAAGPWVSLTFDRDAPAASLAAAVRWLRDALHRAEDALLELECGADCAPPHGMTRPALAAVPS